MKTNLIILSIFTILISTSIIDESFADKKIKLHLGQTINVDDLKFTLHNVDDSRCPSDVTCVWGGQVTATIQIQNQIHTKTVDFIPHDSYIFFSPYKIILLDVSPYPISTEQPDDHIVTLVMFSTDGTPPCEKHMVIKDGFCVPEFTSPFDFRESNSNIRIDDSTFNRQSLQTGETFTMLGTFTAMIIEGLGAILIIFFIILYAIKKRLDKKKNEN